MDFWNLAMRILFLSKISTGILGNSSLIFYYLLLYCRECTLKPTDLILMHLMAANAFIILSAGVPQTMAVWGFKHFLDDFGCTLLLYIQAFVRSVSIGIICLLSVFQALTISPRKSCWKDQKVKVEKNVGCHIFLLWVMYMLIRFIPIAYTFVNRNSKNVTRRRDFAYCSIVVQYEISEYLYAALVVLPEVFFSVLMAWSSGSMIVILYRHKQRVQHIRSTHGSSRNSPESRVTQNILILVSTFLAFYTFFSILRGFISLLYYQNWWLININRLTSLCFPSFVPFFLMYHYSIVSKHCLVWIRNKKNIISF
ncbi:vomeronasal type-1 receptor 4-like [Peromyscus californicus insignis]|uniref:vomeronasal type-1 receptor 4-like n=1 Tax=Peromyscus californicus insignis TaxID=564181 RepID=UPI0022A72920|nr:vomeronasal type-1 receptor 4-like [Peromyscus californicus insignis]